MYLASLDQVKAQRPLEVAWKAFELRPREQPTTPEEDARKKEFIAQGWPHVERMARDVFGLTMKLGPFGVDTRLAHVGYAAARILGQEDGYMRRVFAAYWQDGEDISRRDVLTEAAEEAGIPVQPFLEALDEERFLEEVLQDQERARRLGITAVPATVVAGRYALSGCRPPEDMLALFRRMEMEGLLP